MRTPTSFEHQELLRSIIASVGKTCSFSELLAHGELIAQLHDWCKTALEDAHLVPVASTLYNALEISVAEMALLGIPVDILHHFPNWQTGSRDGFAPQNLHIRLPNIGASHPIGLLRLQLSPFSPTLSAALLLIRRLIEVLDESVKLSVAVEPGGNLEALHEIIGGFGKRAKERVSLIELQMTSVFAQDNARGAASENGDPLVLIPRGFRQEREREREALNTQLNLEQFQLPIVRSNLYWEGGNIINDDRCCFIGIDHIRENMTRLGLSKDEVLALFHAEFGSEIEFLGSFEDTAYHPGEFRPYSTGQASFHIDLDLHVLGKVADGKAPVALLASPEAGLTQLELVLERKQIVADHFLSAEDAREHIDIEYRAYAEERLERLHSYRASLENRGYRVVDVPDLRIDPRDNLFSTRNLDFIYCNVISANHSGVPTIFYLPYNLEPLDALAEKAYRETGCNVVRVSKTGRLANFLMLFNGGLRCACSQIY
jgi:hypothetical protein